MRSSKKFIVSSGLLALASRALAQVASVCPSTGVCFKLNIPEATASSGSGDIFFQISGPSSYEWVALGQGRGMSGSNIFVVYTSADGKNVTLSPRLGTGTQMPNFNDDAQVELLAGSGVSNGVMTANVKCSNCNSWSGDTADFTAGSGNWIYAYQASNGPKNSDDQSATIRQHNERGVFSWNYASAKGGNSVNPLVNAASSGTASGTGTGTAVSCIPRSSQTAASSIVSSSASAANPTQSNAISDDNNYSTRWTGMPSNWPTARPTARPTGTPNNKRQDLPYCDESSVDGTSSSGFTVINSGSASNRTKMLIAHGVLAALAFVILFPAGAIAIRLASFPGVVMLHAVFQVFAYLVYIAGFGLGVYIAMETNLIDHYHPITGIFVFVLISFQPILGFLHHVLFKKYQSRTFWSYAHIWVGRIAITLGIVNGGLGLKLSDSMGTSSKKGIIAYGVVATVMWLAWVASMVIGEKRRKARSAAVAPAKHYEGTRGSDSGVTDVPSPVDEHYAPRQTH